MAKLSSNSSFIYAKELTLAALENGMITESSDPEDTSKKVATFFITAYEELSGLKYE